MPLTRRFSTTISKNPARQQKVGSWENGNGEARGRMVGRLTGYLRDIASQTITRDNFRSLDSLSRLFSSFPSLSFCSPLERLFSSRLSSIRLILNGALWAFRGIDRPQSGNHTESETRSRDFPWVPSPTNDPAAATTMADQPSWIMPCLLRHYNIRRDKSANIFDKLYIVRLNIML
ncbi:hypothetical protein ALC62_15020 [Cyphomyrmex costatus]|uniref:Uncharacterized protein n=1 Tax=Cyphomyrmex costatus TaxID=456900 RepID=A0A195C2D3_9HYME|nr:hypothetical protein ALC62_15020 [Cyphomyrmex costatus]